MKRQTLIIHVILIATIVQVGVAQKGYKDFKWGETIADVSRRVQGWNEVEVGNCFTVAYLAEYAGAPDPIIPHPLAKIDYARVKTYRPKKPDLCFTFIDEKLVAIDVPFNKEYVLSELERKYGTTPTHGASFGSTYWDTKAWFRDSSRIIVYQAEHLYGMNSELTGYEVVSYISRKTYTWLKGMILEEEKATRSKTRSRID